VIAAALSALLALHGPIAPDSTRPSVRKAAASHDSLPPDRWLGSDKVKHALVSGGALAFGFAGLRTVGVDRRPALVGAALSTAAIAVGKEVRDRRVTGRFSARDLVADALGATVYATILARTVR